MLNEIVVASVSDYTKGTVDRNGETPLFLNFVAGKAPNRNIVAGTIGKNLNLEVNQTYMLQVRETKLSPEYGRQFIYTNLGKLSGIDIIRAKNELGEAQLVIIDAEETTSKVEEFKSEFEKKI